MFESVRANGRPKAAERLLALAFSLGLHGIILAAFFVLPLLFLRVIPGSGLITFLVTPPAVLPAKTAPAPARQTQALPRQAATYHEVLRRNDLTAVQMPKGLPPPGNEQPPVYTLPVLAGSGFGLATTSGISGSDFFAGPIAAAPPAIVPPPPRPPRPSVVRVGGTVQESKLVRKVLPLYPEITLRARISGEVLLEVTIDEEGNIAGIHVLHGHPLLTHAAVQAVSQWKYSPTLLNGEPVTVVSTVKVVFRLR